MTRKGGTAPELRARLLEAEATLEAIRTGAVDALVVSGRQGVRTLAIEGATDPYHVLLNAMTDGAVLLTADGSIVFGNRRFAELAGAPLVRMQGAPLIQLLGAEGREAFAALLARADERGGAGEYTLAHGAGPGTPVWISLATLPLENGPADGAVVRMAILTDLTDRRRAEGVRQNLMQRLISVEDEERRRIARELHDETGQSLTALLVGLKAIEELTGLPVVRAAAERLRGIAAETADAVGRLARGLHPSVLDDLGLLAALRRVVSDYTKAHGIAVELQSEGIGARPLAPLIQTTVYRIVQEGLTNVARHARASRVEVELRLAAGTVALRIQDDGAGFDTRSLRPETTGLGLHGMGERVALFGGTLSIDSTPGKGTTLRVRLPTTAAPLPEGA